MPTPVLYLSRSQNSDAFEGFQVFQDVLYVTLARGHFMKYQQVSQRFQVYILMLPVPTHLTGYATEKISNR